MKKFIFLILIVFLIYGCAGSSDSESTHNTGVVTTDNDDGKTDETEKEKPIDKEPAVEAEEETTETTEEIKQSGGDNDWKNPIEPKEFIVLEGKAEAGPCNLFSNVGAMSVDNNWIMSNYVPGWLQDNDGSYMIRGIFDGVYLFYDFYGTCWSEGQGQNIDGFRMKMVQSASAEKHNINNATTLRFAVAQKHFTNPDDPYYNDIPGSFIQAKTEIYNFLGFPSATKNFYELSVVGDTTADAYLFKFELAITKNRTGPEVGDYLGKMANAIIDNDLVFRAEFIASIQDSLIKEPWDNLKAELVERGFSVDPAPLWLTSNKKYYTDLMTRTPNVLESENLGEASRCTIDVNTKNSFAYPIEFSDIESAQYLATELSGDLSIWSVGSCDNGTVFSCPGTQLTTIEELRETLLPDPANLNYNGYLGEHGLISGQFYLVQNFDSNTAPSHTCTGSMAPFGRNLATVDNDWNDAIGWNNSTSWFRRGIKFATTD